MRVTREGDDYTILLSDADVVKATTKLAVPWSVFPQLPYLSSQVEGDTGQEELELLFTSDYDTAHHPKTNDGIYFNRDNEGPIVRFCMPIAGTPFMERGLVVTRHDGDNKIWIRKDDSPENSQS